MAKKPTIQSNAIPLDTQRAATKIGCNQNTLRRYISEGRVNVPRSESGRLCWFDQQIEQARKTYHRDRPGPGSSRGRRP